MKKTLKISFIELLRLKHKNTLELPINLLSYKYLKVANGQVNFSEVAISLTITPF